MPPPAAWTFRRFRPNDRARNSQVEKFFRSDTVAVRPRSVVREGIQNSLDAWDETTGDCIHVRIALGRTSAASVAEFTAGLFPHVEAMRHQLPAAPRPGVSR